jgi:hypothetical protein
MLRGVVPVLLSSGLLGCAWLPGHQSSAPAVPIVDVLQEIAFDGTKTQAFPQVWQRNMLLLDLQAAANQGELVLKPPEGERWPARLAFRVKPGVIARLEVQGEQRVVIPISQAESQEPVDVELAPGVYTADTPQLRLSWSRAVL